MSSMLKKGRKEFKPSGPKIRRAALSAQSSTRPSVERQSQTPAPLARPTGATSVITEPDLVSNLPAGTISQPNDVPALGLPNPDTPIEESSIATRNETSATSQNILKRKLSDEEEPTTATITLETSSTQLNVSANSGAVKPSNNPPGFVLPSASSSGPSSETVQAPQTPSPAVEPIEPLHQPTPDAPLIEDGQIVSLDQSSTPKAGDASKISEQPSLVTNTTPGVGSSLTQVPDHTQDASSNQYPEPATGARLPGLGAAGDVGVSATETGQVAEVSQVVRMAAINPEVTQGIPHEEAEPAPESEKPKKGPPSKRRKVQTQGGDDVRATIEMKLNKPHRIAGQTGTRKKKGDTGKQKKRRAATPDGAEEDVVDHSTVKMSDLCRDLRIGKKFSKHDEIKKRVVQKKLRARLAAGHPELSSLVGGGEEGTGSAQPEAGDSQNAGHVASTGPQMRVIDGQIVLDDSSLQIDRHKRAQAEGIVMEEVEENEFTQITTSGTFMKRERAQAWDMAATDIFYKGLQMFGTDFEMIAKMFPHRNRRQIKLKFNKEERMNHVKINKALIGEKTSIDMEEYQSMTGLKFEEVADIEAERRRIEAEQLMEQEKHAAETAEATRRKKEAIRGKSGVEAGEPTIGTDSAKENEPFGDREASAAPRSRKKSLPSKNKKKNPHSSKGGGEEVEVLGTI